MRAESSGSRVKPWMSRLGRSAGTDDQVAPPSRLAVKTSWSAMTIEPSSAGAMLIASSRTGSGDHVRPPSRRLKQAAVVTEQDPLWVLADECE